MNAGRTLRLSASAKRDIREATRYDNDIRDELGSEFSAQLLATLSQIEKHSASFAIVYKSVRRAKLKQFRYGVFFREHRYFLQIIAVLDLRCDPSTWQRRA